MNEIFNDAMLQWMTTSMVLSKKIGRDWFNLGRLLSFTEGELEAIDNEHWRDHQKIPPLNAFASASNWTKNIDLIKNNEIWTGIALLF